MPVKIKTSATPLIETQRREVTHFMNGKAEAIHATPLTTSTKKQNPKAVDSREFLTDACFQLMETEDFKKITVKQLAEKAGVGRATFYRHYETVEDIVDDYVAELQQKIWRLPAEASVPTTRHADQTSSSSTDIRSATERIFHILAREKRRLYVLKKQGLTEKISQMIYRLTLSTILDLGVMDNKYQPYFFAGASSAMVLAWMEYGMKESPTQMADLFFKSLHGYMELD